MTTDQSTLTKPDNSSVEVEDKTILVEQLRDENQFLNQRLQQTATDNVSYH